MPYMNCPHCGREFDSLGIASHRAACRRKHLCAASGCKARIARTQLMCATHWRMVPRNIQRAVWDAYRFGGRPGDAEYDAAVQRACQAARAAEGIER